VAPQIKAGDQPERFAVKRAQFGGGRSSFTTVANITDQLTDRGF